MHCARGVSVVLAWLGCTAAQSAPGDDCYWPLDVSLPASLPFVDLNQHTCGRGNDYDTYDTCLGSFGSGEEIIYRLHVSAPVQVAVTLDPKADVWAALALDPDCPPAGDDCLTCYGDGSGAPLVLGCRYLAPGLHTLMVDCYATPECGACIDSFDLSITACELPTGACCRDLECVGTMPQAACTDGGEWYEGFECDATFACPVAVDALAVDTCATAYDIAAVPFSAILQTGPVAAGLPPGSCNDPGTTLMQKDVWLKYTPAQEGTLTVRVQYWYDGLIAIYSGPECSVLSELDCGNAGAAGTPDSDLATLPVSAGVTYWLQIGDDGFNGVGGATLLALSVPVAMLTGDVDCSGSVGFDDINPFVLLLSNPTAWQTTFPGCPLLNGDIDGDGTVNFDDINPFVTLLSSL